MTHIIRKLVPNSLIKFIKNKAGVPSQKTSLTRLKEMGYLPAYCLDIGAYEGTWTQEFKTIFPTCSVTMIEPQFEKEELLRKTMVAFYDVDYHIALLGAEEKVVLFNKYETASSILEEYYPTGAHIDKRQLSRLDTLALSFKNRPDFIKIDTQGYELEIMKGGLQTIDSAEFIMLEVSFLDIYKQCPLAHKIISFMDERGFVIYDICSIMKRPLDNALYQADFLFAKKQSRFREDKRWE